MDVKPTKLLKSDYRKVANLHCENINQGFLATLGVPFLTLLYEAIDNDSKSVLLLERVDNSVVGFISGGSGLGRIYKQLLKKPFRLIFSLRSCILSPSRIYKILEIILLNKKNKKAFKNLPQNELLSIVINPIYQGESHAKNLFNSLCSHFKEEGESSFKIIVGSNLERAHAFYLKMGSIPIREIQIHKGVGSIIYLKKLS